MIEDEIKTALLDRDFDRAQSLIGEWGKSIAVAMQAAAGEAARRRIYDEARTVVESNTYLARVVRAQIATELHANSASFLYRNADLEQPRWQIKA
jgi:hypothetical protein